MDEERSADALVDQAIDRQLEATLAVDPSPEFLARVRTRIASEPEPSAWRLSWAFTVTGTAVVAMVLAVAVFRSGPMTSSAPADSSLLPARTIDSPFAAVPTIAPGQLLDAPPDMGRSAVDPSDVLSGSRPTETVVQGSGPDRAGTVRALASSLGKAEPEVLINAAEARALRRLLAGARAGRIDLTPLPEVVPASAALQSPMEIVIAPIGVEPLAPINVEGARQ